MVDEAAYAHALKRSAAETAVYNPMRCEVYEDAENFPTTSMGTTSWAIDGRGNWAREHRGT